MSKVALRGESRSCILNMKMTKRSTIFVFFFMLQIIMFYSAAENCPKKEPAPTIQANFTCDDKLYVYVDGKQVGQVSQGWQVVNHYTIPQDARVVAVKCYSGIKQAINGGILGSLSNGMMTNDAWHCSSTSKQGWTEAIFDDSSWPIAIKHGANSHNSIEAFPWLLIENITVGAWWIWTKDNKNNDSTVYCRLQLRNDSIEECIVDSKSDLFYIDKTFTNRSLNGSVIKTIAAASSIECGLRCHVVSQCASFNYEFAGNGVRKACELNSKQLESSDDLVERRGYVYFNSVFH